MKTFSLANWPLLMLIGLVSTLLGYDFSSIDVALANIRDHLHFSPEATPWIMSGNSLTFGGFLLLGGRLGDLYGRKRILLAGTLLYAIFATLGACAPNASVFLLSRVVTGLGAALLVPNTVAVINTTFPVGKELNKAFGFFGFFGEAGYATGNCLGGVLTTYDWRATVGLSAILAFAIFFIGRRALSRDEHELAAGGFDFLGAVSSIFAVGLLLAGVTDALDLGWLAPRTLIEAAVSVVCGAFFFWRVYHHPHPILPPDILTNRNVLGAGLIIFLLMGCGQGTMVQIILFLQDVLKYSPQQTGMALFPFITMTLTSSFFINRLLDSIGFRKTIAIGLCFMTASLIWLISLSPATTYIWGFVPIMIVWNLGFPLASIGTRLPAGMGIAEEKQGIAYGVHYSYEQLAMTFGITILSEINVAAANAHPVPDLGNLVYGFRVSTIISAVLLSGALLLNYWLLVNPQREQGSVPSTDLSTGFSSSKLSA
jgi:MFS family permease